MFVHLCGNKCFFICRLFCFFLFLLILYFLLSIFWIRFCFVSFSSVWFILKMVFVLFLACNMPNICLTLTIRVCCIQCVIAHRSFQAIELIVSSVKVAVAKQSSNSSSNSKKKNKNNNNAYTSMLTSNSIRHDHIYWQKHIKAHQCK